MAALRVVHQWPLKHPRFWLTERWLAELTNRKLRRSARRGVTELESIVQPLQSAGIRSDKFLNLSNERG